MKQWILGVLALGIFGSVALAEDLKVQPIGSLVSYVNSVEDASGTVVDMQSMPVVGLNFKGQGTWQVEGQIRMIYENSTIDLLDQWIALENETCRLFLGHKEFMDTTIGGNYVVWIDGSSYVGDYGIVGHEDLLQMTMKDLGVSLSFGQNNLPTGSASNTFDRTFTSINYKSEGESLDFSLTANSASDTNSADAVYNGQKLSAVSAGVSYKIEEGTAVSINLQSTSTQAGNSTTAVAATTTLVILDWGFAEGQGVTVKLSGLADNNTTTNHTLVSYANEVAPGTLWFVAYSSDGTTTEVGSGVYMGL